MTSSPAPKKGKQQIALDTLRERIQSGQYGPGFPLVIDRLAKELGMSQTPIREAIRQLVADGLVTYNRHSSATVATIDMKAYGEILSLLAVLEGYATAEAAPHIEPADIDDLRALNADMKAAVESFDVERFSRINRAFHKRIYDRCPNGLLLEILQNTWLRLDTVRRNIFAFIPGRVLESVREHDALIDMLASKAPVDEIERVAREHKTHVLDAFNAWREQLQGSEGSVWNHVP